MTENSPPVSSRRRVTVWRVEDTKRFIAARFEGEPMTPKETKIPQSLAGEKRLGTAQSASRITEIVLPRSRR